MEPIINSNNLLSCEIKNLNVFYGRKQVLRNISLDISARGITAWLGPSGCGKSTLLNCLNRLNDLNKNCRIEGSVAWSNLSVYPQCSNTLELRKQIGYIAQTPNPFPTSIRKNFHLPLKEFGVKNKQTRESIMIDNLKRVGLFEEVKDQLKQNALHLSGGQQQRLCIARALSLNPRALLMDEPTSSLDPFSTEIIEHLIQGLKITYPIILVTHNIAQAKRLADHLAIFWTRDNSGVCLESGTKDEIIYHSNNPKTQSYLKGILG